jgi:hypothetical protein
MLLHNLEVAEQITKATTTAFYTWYILLFIELGVCSNEVRNCCRVFRTNEDQQHKHIPARFQCTVTRQRLQESIPFSSFM